MLIGKIAVLPLESGAKLGLKVRDFALQFKADGVTDDGKFFGYGSVFGNKDSYGEVVAPGAFTESLAEIASKGRKVPVLWQHRSDQPIGVYDSIVEDERGLKVSGQLLHEDVALAREALALMKAGAVSGLSIGYWVRGSNFDDKTKIRTLTKLDLEEVSLVTFPANDDARVEAVKFKFAHGELPTIREFEKFLRDVGASKSQAAAIAGRGLSNILQGDPDSSAKSESVNVIRDALAKFTLPKI